MRPLHLSQSNRRQAGRCPHRRAASRRVEIDHAIIASSRAARQAHLSDPPRYFGQRGRKICHGHAVAILSKRLVESAIPERDSQR